MPELVERRPAAFVAAVTARLVLQVGPRVVSKCVDYRRLNLVGSFLVVELVSDDLDDHLVSLVVDLSDPPTLVVQKRSAADSCVTGVLIGPVPFPLPM